VATSLWQLFDLAADSTFAKTVTVANKALSPFAAGTAVASMVIVTVARGAQPIALLKILFAHPKIAELAACIIVISASRARPITRLPMHGVLEDARWVHDIWTP
jgi:hypothetical protein